MRVSKTTDALFGYFENLVDPLAESVIERPPTKTLDFFKHYLLPLRRLLIVTLSLAGIAALTELFLYVFLGKLVDWMANTSPSQFFEVHGLSLMFMILVAAIIRPLTMLASRALISLALAPGVANTVRWRNHRYVSRQSLNYFQNDFAGRIAQKIMQTGNAVREATINVIDGVWLLLIYLVGTVWLFGGIDGRLLIPIAVWLLSYLIVIWWLVPPVRRRSAALSEATSGLTGRVVDGYTNIQSVKLFAHASAEDEFVGESIAQHTTAFRRLMRAIVGMTAALTALNTMLIVVNAGLSILFWSQGTISIGAVAIANGLVIRLSQMSGWILRTITALFENIGVVENGIETISQNTAVQDKPDAPELLVARGEVRFDSVWFDYGNDVVAVKDFSLAIQPGEKVGLVGRSGAGKSTLVNLLLRFFDIDRGRVLIDGQDISTVSQQSLRQNIGMVTQDTSLMHRSITDNIRYGAPDADEEAVMRAARTAAASDFIPMLTDPVGRRGFDAYVGERGVKLSGGQRQRIALARVVLKDAPILVLDEATSALDSEVESIIQQQLNTLMEGKTVIAIAHRLSTIAALDRLVVIDEGRIVEQGSHESLLEQGGLYAELWCRQSGGFLGLDLVDRAS